MNSYLVIALYEDNDQRYATTVQADTAEKAEETAQAQPAEDGDFDDDHPLIIAAVLLDGKIVA